MLIQEFHSLLERGWQSAFPGARSQKRAIEHAIALPCVFGRRTISRTLGALGRWDQDWSADYKMFSRSQWKPERLDRKSTRLNSSHQIISYAVFCLKKKKQTITTP